MTALLTLAFLAMLPAAQSQESSELFCPNSTSNWTCGDFDSLLRFGGSQMAGGLRCLGYERDKMPMLFEMDEVLKQWRHVLVNLKFTHVNDFNDQKQVRPADNNILLSFTPNKVTTNNFAIRVMDGKIVEIGLTIFISSDI
jgi:hypothetical protein